MKTLIKDPLNIIIIGVAGQGNVMTSLLVCNALVREGYVVTFGQTYLPQQRGGPVINYIRVSKESVHSPIIPQGDADLIVGMEPVEAMRMLTQYGNPDVVTVVNPKMIGSIDIARLKGGYPNLEKLLEDISERDQCSDIASILCGVPDSRTGRPGYKHVFCGAQFVFAIGCPKNILADFIHLQMGSWTIVVTLSIIEGAVIHLNDFATV